MNAVPNGRLSTAAEDVLTELGMPRPYVPRSVETYSPIASTTHGKSSHHQETLPSFEHHTWESAACEEDSFAYSASVGYMHTTSAVFTIWSSKCRKCRSQSCRKFDRSRRATSCRGGGGTRTEGTHGAAAATRRVRHALRPCWAAAHGTVRRFATRRKQAS